MKSVLSAVTFAVAIPLSLGACVVVDSQGHIAREEKRFTVSGTPELRLTTFDGSIEIRAGDAKSVVVEIEKRGPTKEAIDQLTVDARQDGNKIEIAVKRPTNEIVVFGIGRMSSTAKLIVTMPGAGHVNARSGDGSIRVEHVRGRLELRTGDGSIRATDVGGDMVLATGDGSITIDNVDGNLDADTGDGSVSVAGKLGVVKVHTGDGSITFRAEPGTAMTGDWSMTTGDGGVSLYLPSDFGAELDAHTGDGAIRNELQVESAKDSSGEDGERARRTLKGRLGAGGRTLRIRTGDGAVRLKAS
jgi:hypothetical protein